VTVYLKELAFLTMLSYVLAAACYWPGSKKKKIARLASGLAVLGLILNSLALYARTLLTGRLPLVNGAEFMLCFTWFTVLVYLGYEYKSKQRSAGGIVLLIAACLTGSILILTPHQLGDISPLMPALKSPWLTGHVLTAVFAYGGFAVAAGLAVVQLRNPFTKREDWVARIVGGSFAMLTLTIVLGAIWAEQTWGNYWSWDPKETWALLTWIIYAIYLHLYRRESWQGRKANLLVIGGFILVLFTYFGVNYVLTGLHSYA
jgi:ABC-type transport system involved in cytochrome c biogenesis permease subunit